VNKVLLHADWKS